MTGSARLRLLRIRRPATLLTAQSYEDLFERQLGSAFDVTVAPLEAWCDAILGPAGTALALDMAAPRFAEHTAGQDFFCPSYECIPLAPLLLAVRNRARARVRLLFIAHAAGAYSFEWTLLRPLLASGDIIVAPSESARRTIEYLCPALAPFIRTIPHPMERLTPTAGRLERPRIVSLGRVHAEKLIHRQIEAMAILRTRGLETLRMEIGGPLDDGGWNGPHPYTLTLREQVRRLDLHEHVHFVGPVRGDQAKSAFLSGAAALINLSVTIEESFPKTPVEALGLGIPVVGTDWNGLRDTVGPNGRLVPVALSGGASGGVAVDAVDVADAIESVLASPPPAQACIAWAEQFSPAAILPRYRAALEEGAAASGGHDAWRDWPEAQLGAAPMTGLLAHAAPLSAFSWRELFATYLSFCDAVRATWTGEALQPNAGSQVRGIVLAAVDPALKRFFARLPPLAASARPAIPRKGPADLLDRLADAGRGGGLMAGRAGCLSELIAAGRLEQARTVLDALAADDMEPSLVAYWQSELAAATGDAPRALALSLACVEARHLGDADWPLVRQAARAARRAGQPGVALPLLLAWLQRFPDSQESGPVWLDACVNGMRTLGYSPARTEAYHERARVLLGDLPAVTKCGAMLRRAQHAWARIA